MRALLQCMFLVAITSLLGGCTRPSPEMSESERTVARGSARAIAERVRLLGALLRPPLALPAARRLCGGRPFTLSA